MSDPREDFPDFLKEETERYNSSTMVPVNASLLERLLRRRAAPQKMHPNPDDEFTWPSVGPNYGIVSKYEQMYTHYGTMTEWHGMGSSEEPLMVQKVLPDGFMLLNGHHRWAAYMRLGVTKKVRIEIINLTKETDIERMLQQAMNTKRVSLDLDEVVFAGEEEEASEPLRPSLFGNKYRERIRAGVPALLNHLSNAGYDIWVYTSEYYSMDYIRLLLSRYHIRVVGIITGAGRNKKTLNKMRKKVHELIRQRYTETIHIDRNAVLRTSDTHGDYEEIPIAAGMEAGWADAAIKAVDTMIKGMEHEGDGK